MLHPPDVLPIVVRRLWHRCGYELPAAQEVDMTMTRGLGRSGRMVSALGFGCWAIGGPWRSDGQPAGWGEVDDQESVAAIRRACEASLRRLGTDRIDL